MWIQLFVKAPSGNGYQTPRAMQRVDEHLTGLFAAAFCCPAGLPVQEPDGTWEVRVFMPDQAELVKMMLTNHYGLEVVREVEQN